MNAFWTLSTRYILYFCFFAVFKKLRAASGERDPGTPCFEVFQCIEDQVEDKCEHFTTPAPSQLDGDKIVGACKYAKTVLASQPGLAANKPKLKLILIKGNSLSFLLFSAHISYGKGNYFNQTVFLQNLQSTKFIFNFKGVTHRIQLT